MVQAFLSLGSNIGDKLANLQEAISLLKKHDQIDICQVSHVYETDPVGYEQQAVFYNIVVEIDTILTPEKLLAFCLQTEKVLGRVHLFKWGPRLIDIDILLYQNVVRNEATLKIPHPYMKERAFVMIPLLEIAPNIAKKLVNTNVIKQTGVRKTQLELNW
ncbi:2-amino-4-hydroxy-6-hydroxymethyldihydropteridine diphosphokinase [Listeria sp. PSOL-1]|uniref:2-amino-4-hydroxy-6- hydroxymethyldihydropteridine diphosphokinase n=1 Tax=Listeria sp. PSOL-1 TaxID=1844999 RepID=UPI0013D3CB7C|nr:2-amino-4-hydroxy-6-hydroxymethyldihydropteridine diphosphokinase [Listeria sp. PSOL-1]